MINKVTLIGRLTKEPEVKRLANDTCVASFTLAVDRTFKSKDGEKEADFIPIVVWRKTAELCEKYLSKGSLAAVAGRIQTRNYDAADGTKRYISQVIADEVQFLSSSQKELKDDMSDFAKLNDLPVPF